MTWKLEYFVAAREGNFHQDFSSVRIVVVAVVVVDVGKRGSEQTNGTYTRNAESALLDARDSRDSRLREQHHHRRPAHACVLIYYHCDYAHVFHHPITAIKHFHLIAGYHETHGGQSQSIKATSQPSISVLCTTQSMPTASVTDSTFDYP